MIVALHVETVHALRGDAKAVAAETSKERSWREPQLIIRDGSGIASGIGPRCLADDFKRSSLERPIECGNAQGVVAAG